jgi:hypothetical protein
MKEMTTETVEVNHLVEQTGKDRQQEPRLLAIHRGNKDRAQNGASMTVEGHREEDHLDSSEKRKETRYKQVAPMRALKVLPFSAPAPGDGTTLPR